MKYGLSEGLSFCECGGEAVILDELRDRYFLAGASSGKFLLQLSREGKTTPAGIERLARMNLITEGVNRAIASTQIRPPTRSIIEDRNIFPRRDRTILPAVIASITSAYLSLKFWGFARSIRALEDRRTRRRSLDGNQNVSALSLSFERARRLIPVQPSCLLDSLSLLNFLAGRGYTSPNLIFGVKLHPFAAHCWVQSDDVILNEFIDYASGFTPIRVA